MIAILLSADTFRGNTTPPEPSRMSCFSWATDCPWRPLPAGSSSPSCCGQSRRRGASD